MSTETNADPCIYCGESTAFGSGRYVNRIPADVEDEQGYRDGYACAECTEPVAYSGMGVTTCADCTTDADRDAGAWGETWSDLVESGVPSLRCDRCGETIYARTGGQA